MIRTTTNHGRIRPGTFPGIVFSATAGDWASLTPEQFEIAKDGGDPFAVLAAPAAEAEPEAELEPPAGDEPAPEEQPVEPEPGTKGDPGKALRNARNQVAQLEDLLTNPDKLASYVRKLGFDLSPAQQQQAAQAAAGAAAGDGNPYGAFDDETASALQAIIGPLQQKLDEAQGKLDAVDHLRRKAEERAAVAEAEKEFPGLSDVVAEFDQQRPDLAGSYSPLDKYLLTHGARITDPDSRAEHIGELLAGLGEDERRAILAPYVKTEATNLLAERIKPSASKAKPVTLGGAAPARTNDVMPEIQRVTKADWAKMTPEQRQHYLT